MAFIGVTNAHANHMQASKCSLTTVTESTQA